MNSVDNLNRWVTEDNLDELGGFMWFDGGMASEESLKRQMCRVCNATFFAYLQDNGVSLSSHMAGAYWNLRTHMESQHPEMWRLMSFDLNSNKLPYI